MSQNQRPKLRLVIANKLYSSWSLRPWLLLRAIGVPFDETVIPLYRPETAAAIAVVSPSGRVPVLIDGDISVWETTAIVEHLAERFPDKPVWPSDARARAHARAVSAEMHAGFQALRQACPMNLARRFAARADLSPEVAANVARIEALWADARGRFGAGGPFLYGAFSAADAMFAPVVTRLDTYQLPVSVASRAYMNAVLAHPAFVAWRDEALAEPWLVPHYEEGWTAVATFAAAAK